MRWRGRSSKRGATASPTRPPRRSSRRASSPGCSAAATRRRTPPAKAVRGRGGRRRRWRPSIGLSLYRNRAARWGWPARTRAPGRSSWLTQPRARKTHPRCAGDRSSSLRRPFRRRVQPRRCRARRSRREPKRLWRPRWLSRSRSPFRHRRRLRPPPRRSRLSSRRCNRASRCPCRRAVPSNSHPTGPWPLCRPGDRLTWASSWR